MVPVRSLRSPDAACGGAAEPGVRCLSSVQRVINSNLVIAESFLSCQSLDFSCFDGFLVSCQKHGFVCIVSFLVLYRWRSGFVVFPYGSTPAWATEFVSALGMVQFLWRDSSVLILAVLQRQIQLGHLLSRCWQRVQISWQVFGSIPRSGFCQLSPFWLNV